MLIRMLYASRAAASITPAVVDAILEKSRKNNADHGITGMLCYSDDVFLQALEGDRDKVCELFCKIVRDERNSGVRILSYEEIVERHFGSWTMGKVDITKVNASLLLKYSAKATLDPFSGSGHASMALLNELIATAAVVNRGG